MRERRSVDAGRVGGIRGRGFGGEEGEEEGVLEERETERGAGGAEREDEAEVAGAGVEEGHVGRVGIWWRVA